MFGHLVESWVSLYANHPSLKTAIAFLHVGGLVAAGGCAVAADLATLTTSRETPERRLTKLELLKRTHAIVFVGLAAILVSGLLLTAADLETFLYSRVFWLKMALMALLLGNGGLLFAGERAAARGEVRAWARLHLTAVASLVLWFLTTLAGAALPNIG